MPFRPISSSSLESVPAVVSFKSNGVYRDLSADAVAMAFLPDGQQPVSGDAKTASWDVDSTTSPITYTALCLIGAGGAATLVAGVYAVWVKVTDSPEIPWLRVDLLTVT